MSGNGTNTIDYTVPAIATNDVITMSYNATTGKIIDFSRNKLESFTNQAVANSDVTAPVLQTATTRVENEYSTPNQLVLAYNEPLKTDSFPVAADITVSPANTLSSATVAGSEMILTFANPFPAKTGITLSTANGKIKDTAGNSAANLSNQTVNNWIAVLMSGYSFVPLPVTTGMSSTNNFWRTSSRNLAWGNGNRIGMKLPAGVDGGIAQHYAKPVMASAIGFRTVDDFAGGLGAPVNGGTWFQGLFVDINQDLTYCNGNASPKSALLKKGVLGNWYRVWRVGSTLTLEESTDGVNWTILHTYFGTYGGDLYAMFDIPGHQDSKIQFPQHQGLVTV
jgi:hypothetical protein